MKLSIHSWFSFYSIHYYHYLFCSQIVLFLSSGSPSKLDMSFWHVLIILFFFLN